MLNPIGSIQPAGSITPISLPGEKTQATSSGAFAEIFSEAVQRVESYRTNAEQTVQRFLSGEEEEVHKVAMETQKAELAFEMFLQVKNKAVQAYQEIMRMQL